MPGICPEFVKVDLRSQLFPQVAPCQIFGGERCLQLGGGSSVSAATDVTKEAFYKKLDDWDKNEEKVKEEKMKENYKRK